MQVDWHQEMLYALEELAEDTREYLKLLERFKQAQPGSEEYSDLEAELHVHATLLKAHAADVEEVMHRADDAKPEAEPA